MELILFYMLTSVLVYGDMVADPVHAAWTGQSALRALECERLTQAEAHARHPVDIPPPHPRAAALMEIDALVCHHQVLDSRLRRRPRDAAILQRLDEEVGMLSGLAVAAAPQATRWIVDGYYPDPAMVRKIVVAARTTLAERGVVVSDQPPPLSAGDVRVLRDIPMRDAVPFACQRLARRDAAGNAPLADDVAFLSLALLHPSETQLHAGICHRGVFRWLR